MAEVQAPKEPDTGRLIHEATRADGTIDIVKLVSSITAASYCFGFDDAVFVLQNACAAVPAGQSLSPEMLLQFFAMAREK